jgi:hypothetical protein
MDVWRARRMELLGLFSDTIYGWTPGLLPDAHITCSMLQRGPAPGGGVRMEFGMTLTGCVGGNDDSITTQVLLYLPGHMTKPAPVFLFPNFAGNHSIHTDPGIQLSHSWMYPWDGAAVVDHRASEAGRGCHARRSPVERILQRGYGVATFYPGDWAPDTPDHPQTKRFKSFFESSGDAQSEWGSLAIWAWMLSKVRERLAALPEVDAARIIALGHSRMGKTALWAAARDEQFAGVIANNSGCLGAALSRRVSGETVDAITRAFPHWFAPRLRSYAGREEALPVDQHQLLALMAPRPLYVSSASEDLWADPPGEFLATQAASTAYAMYGFETLAGHDFPPPGVAVLAGRVGYHLRQGKHDVLPSDWEFFLNFCNRCSPL